MEALAQDSLLTTMLSNNLLNKDKYSELMVGKSPNQRNVNELLTKVIHDLNEKDWLASMTEKLLSIQYVIQNEAGTHGNTIPDFHYIPVPGKDDGLRILHPSENPKPQARLNPQITNQEFLASPLSTAPIERSREMAWAINHRTQAGTRLLLFVLTFDPNHLGRLRNSPDQLAECKAYWETAAKSQGVITGKENPPHLFLHGFTGIHEWMETLFPTPGKQKNQWTRHPVPEEEKNQAAVLGLDIYYSNPLIAFGWSTLEKQKGQEVARLRLQQKISKKVTLFAPIFGKNHGEISPPKKTIIQRIKNEETQEEITARALWETTIRTAYTTGASDIHIEPVTDAGKKVANLIVSLRKDNNIGFFAKCPPNMADHFLRFSLESSGIIRSDTRIAQDGRKTWINPRTKTGIDLRISMTPMPGASQPEVVIRLLDNTKLKRGMLDLGLEPEEIELWNRALTLDEALILVSGPTGSGKSSTLFAAMCDIYLRDNSRKFTTVEDPIEYTLPFRSTQHQIDESVGMTFARYIRQLTRNDGDTVLLGEIRDAETLYAALQLGLTGHQILSTIHAKSAADTILRMLEFKPEPYIVSEVVKLVVAQRLAGTPCPICSKTLSYKEAEELIQKGGGLQTVLATQDKWKKKHPHVGDGKWIQGEGCPSCKLSGIQGKTAVQEFLVVNSQNKKYLKDGNVGALNASMYEKGFHNLETTAWKLAWLGRIPISEAIQLTNALEQA